MALVHRLPAELLVQTFSSLIADFSMWAQYPDLARHRSILCAVCSRWRTIALSTHMLWASISIERPSNGADSYSQPLSLFKLQLERSGDTVPLAIRFVKCLQPILMRIWAILGPHFHRIRSVIIITKENNIARLLPIPKALQLTGLACVDGDRAGTRQTLVTKDNLVRSLEDVPSLRSLNMENVAWTALRNIPLNQLTALKMILPNSSTRHPSTPEISWTDVSEVLLQCTSLVSLHVDVGVSTGETLPSGTIHLPQLQRLTTHNSTIPSILRTPNLESIHLLEGGVNCDPQQPLPHLIVAAPLSQKMRSFNCETVSSETG
ncbi:hypothetical protein DL93DRAFT_2163888 [Clavulina sp. PMI_390]|nr:hypothetical protein DL93DRAFT_2163888 [Clavulina sp. PMI_390]